MRNQFRQEYLQELRELRRLGDKFSRKHPKAAANLRLNQEENEDPAVSRLLESMAFLNARLRQKIISSQDKVVEDLFHSSIGSLSSPVPSFSIAKLVPNSALESSEFIARHTQLMSSRAAQGRKKVNFRSVYDLEVLPLEVADSRFSEGPFSSQVRASSVIEIKIATSNGNPISSIPIDSLRFYLGFADQDCNNLLEMMSLYRSAISIHSENGEQFIDNSSFFTQGMDIEESVLPYGAKTSASLHLLRESFLFPQKHFFFKIGGCETRDQSLDKALSQIEGETATIRIYCNHSFRGIKEALSTGGFHLNCTPIVNLYEKKFEPIKTSYDRYEYHVNADLRDFNSSEIYSIDKVSLTTPDLTCTTIEQLYRPDRVLFDQENSLAYLQKRRLSSESVEGEDTGTEIYLDFSGPIPDASTIESSGLATNRGLADLTADEFGGRPNLQLKDQRSMVLRVESVIGWSSSKWPYFNMSPVKRKSWMGLMQLNQDHFAREDGLQALLLLLNTYCLAPTGKDKDAIQSFIGLDSETCIEKIWSGNLSSRVLGVRFTLTHQKSKFSGSMLLTLCRLIEILLADHCATNSFVKVCFKSTSDEEFVFESPSLVGLNQTL